MRQFITLPTAAALPAAALLVATSCDSGPGPLDTEPVAELVDEILDDALDRDDDFVDFEECIIDDADDIIEELFDDIDDDAVQATLRSEFLAGAFANSAGDSLDCSYGDDESGDAVGVYLLEAPRDLEDFHIEFATGDEGDPDGTDVDIDEGEEFRGGQFFEVCVDIEDAKGYCELDWIDEHVLIGVYVVTDDPQDTDLDDALPAFEAALPDIIENLGNADPRDAEVIDLGS